MRDRFSSAQNDTGERLARMLTTQKEFLPYAYDY